MAAAQDWVRCDIAACNERTESLLEARARSELLASAYSCIRDVACHVRGAVLTLRGRVPSYFHKQVAQEVVLQERGDVVTVQNHLQVRWMGRPNGNGNNGIGASKWRKQRPASWRPRPVECDK